VRRSAALQGRVARNRLLCPVAGRLSSFAALALGPSIADSGRSASPFAALSLAILAHGDPRPASRPTRRFRSVAHRGGPISARPTSAPPPAPPGRVPLIQILALLILPRFAVRIALIRWLQC
jgi:hypothetical protein